MSKLQVGRSYTNDLSDLAIRVNSILEETEDTIGFLGTLYAKRNHWLYETKIYIMEKDEIKFHGWYEISE